MFPVLFTIGRFNVYAFGFFLSIAFLLSTFIVWKYAKEELKEEEYLDAFLYTCIAALLGARAIYILWHFEEFGTNILRYIVVREAPGLSLLGGFLSGAIFLFWYSHKKRLSFWQVSDLFSLAGSFALTFAKIGEQLGGGSFGKATNFILGVKIAGKTGRYHPVELYEAILIFLLACVLAFIYKKVIKEKWPEGSVACIFAFAVGLILFLLEFLKTNTIYLYGLGIRQLLAMILMGLVLIPLWRRFKIIKGAKS